MSISTRAIPEKTKLLDEYGRKLPLYERAITEILYILKSSLKLKQVKISSIQKRVKKFESLYEKIDRKGISGDIFEQIEDIAGIRIICVYRSELIPIEETIRRCLSVIKADLLRNRAVSSFGYLSDHYIVKIPESYTGIRYDNIKNIKCEIQVRTISMHAWATVSHQLDYKQELDIPSNLKNDFSALSGVFYIADSLFERFKIAREKSLKSLRKRVRQKHFDLCVELNLDTMRAYLLWKFPDREYGGKNDISNILKLLSRVGIDSYQKLDAITEENYAWLVEEEKVNFCRSHNPEKPHYVSTGVIRGIIRHKFKVDDYNTQADLIG